MSDRPLPGLEALDGPLFGVVGGGTPWSAKSEPLTPESWAKIVAEDQRRRDAGEYDVPRTILLSPQEHENWIALGLLTPDGRLR